MVTLQKFRRIWLKFRPLPRLHTVTSLRIPPEQQFLRELRISLGSWSDNELARFLELVGERVPRCPVAKCEAARWVVDEIFDVWDDPALGPICETDFIHEVLKNATRR